jgi:membrane associated rhomboid family serine protease
MIYGGIASGVLAWLIGGRGTVHIGASGVLFGLIGYLLANGLFRRGFLAPVLGVIVLVLFGTVLGGMLPSARTSLLPISWEMHLGGFLGGVMASWDLRNKPAH